MGTKIIFATGNQGKMREIRAILADVDAGILSMKEAGIDIDIVEDGRTFEENAVIKAKAVAEELRKTGVNAGENDRMDTGKAAGTGADEGDSSITDVIIMADDSGLEIDYLNKEPGVYSARYMGEETPFSEKMENFLERLKGVPEEKRTARFVCAIAAVFPNGETVTTIGVIEGRIDYEQKGDNGFGYDPFFYVPEYGCTAGQLSDSQKNAISHRARALQAMKEELKRRMSG